MSWEAIDLFELEASWFSFELREVIVPLFDQTSKTLAKWEEERKGRLKEMLAGAKNDDEVQYAREVANLEERHNVQRGRILGAAELHYLYSTLKERLKELTWWFHKTHPPASAGYQGKSELERLKQEYLGRFGLDLETSPLFGSIVELALARNAGIHPDAMEEYIEKVESPRFSKGGEFFVEHDAFLEILDETEQFFEWVAQALVPLRKS